MHIRISETFNENIPNYGAEAFNSNGVESSLVNMVKGKHSELWYSCFASYNSAREVKNCGFEAEN